MDVKISALTNKELNILDVKTLLSIVDNRIKSNDGNPTSRSFLFELHSALERLQSYEAKEKENKEN